MRTEKTETKREKHKRQREREHKYALHGNVYTYIFFRSHITIESNAAYKMRSFLVTQIMPCKGGPYAQ